MEIDDQELTDEFETFEVTIPDDDIMDKLKQLCSSYRLDAFRMATEWVAFSHTNKGCKLSLETLDHMERSRLNKKGKQAVKTPNTKTSKSNMIYDINTLENVVGDEDNILGTYSTPNAKTSGKRHHTPDQPTNKRLTGISGSPAVMLSPASFSPSQATPSQKYSARTNSGQVVCNHGDVSKTQWATRREGPAEIKPFDVNQNLSAKFKYMFQKLSDKAAVLNDLLEEMGTKLQKHHNIEEFSHIALPVQEEVTILGRVSCDSVGKLNAKSVVLEGCRTASAGRRIAAELSDVKQYSLFPGQMVVMDGINNTGVKLVVKRVREGVMLPLPENATVKEDSLRLMVVCGPLTTTDSLMYEPLADLVKALHKAPPDVCIMLGPFVDVKNPEIEKGTLDATYEEFFNNTVEKLAMATQKLPTQLVIVPSQRDVHHEPVYPQPPFTFKHEFKHLNFVSDPCTLSIDGVVVGLTSTDVLFHLGSEEISCPPGSSDRLGRLTQHLLTQHNYYPLYPPHDDVNVDYDHYEAYAQMPVRPHVLIVPSDLRYFIKDIEGTLCLNPGRLTKGHVGGTYARIIIDTANHSGQNSLTKSTIAEVVRI